MKYLLKGFALGISLNIADRVCGMFCGVEGVTYFISGIIFYLIITAFLISDDISHMLLTGFSGIFFMFFGEIFIFYKINNIGLEPYYAGLHASVLSIITASLIIHKRTKSSEPSNEKVVPKLHKIKKREEFLVDKNININIKLLIYTAITAILFPYLVLPENVGISVVIFTVIQFICLWFIVPDRKRLIFYVPVFIMALNCFISASDIWLVSNCILSLVLFCSMFINFDIKKDSLDFLQNIAVHTFSPVLNLKIPFEWCGSIAGKKVDLIKRVVLALIITIPCTIILVLMLAKADMIFSVKTNNVLTEVFSLFSFNVIVKIIIGFVVALFLFGAVYNSYKEDMNERFKLPRFKGDMIVINIVLCAILFVYTLFVIIQFKYLFAGKVLPDGFTYTEYARKGFFELLGLTGINIAVILTVIKLTKEYSGKWMIFTKILCHYLCAVTIVLLVSSYFRMQLYVNDDGLTRLRLFVIGFLAFEAIGLLITFVYIAKPKFNLTMVYLVIALCYYTVLNVVPADYIIAKNQIDKYISGARGDISYVFTLSLDAAPALNDLKAITDDKDILSQIDVFFKYKTESEIPERWQRFNLSVERAKSFIER